VSSPAAAVMAGGGRRAHTLAKRKAAFYSRACSQASMPRSEVTGALKHGVRRPSACVRSGRTDGAAASTRTPRDAWARRPRSALEVRAGLTQAVLTRGLLGGAVVRRHMAEAQRRRVGARARVTSRRRVPALGSWHVPLFTCTILQKLQLNFKIRR
jgi:hypothetical protein